MRKRLEEQAIVFPRSAVQLPFQNPGRCHGRDAHTVPNEQNDVLGPTPVGKQFLTILNKVLPSIEPLLDRFRTLDDRLCSLRWSPGTAEHGYGKGSCNRWT